MIVIRFNSGSLGHFLSYILIGKLLPPDVFDYGGYNKNEVFHTGAWETAEHDLTKNFAISKYPAVTHNNPLFDDQIEKLRTANNQFVFIDTNGCYIEYRLNYLAKVNLYAEKQNTFAKNISWKNFAHPVACDEARRSWRLRRQEEQMIKKRKGDVVFAFENFYIQDKVEWMQNLERLSIDINVPIKNLHMWYDNFFQGQKTVIEKAHKIRQAVRGRYFLKEFNDNEKGIVLGEYCCENGIDDNNAFDDVYDVFDII